MKFIALFTAFSHATVTALYVGSQGSSSPDAAGRNLLDEAATLKKRAINECGYQRQEVSSNLESCGAKATKAADVISKGLTGRDKELFDQYFGGNDPSTVAENFRKIAAGCSQSNEVTIECRPNEECTLQDRPGQTFFATASKNRLGDGAFKSIRLCRGAFSMGRGGGCREKLSSLADLLVHEMSHATLATEDIAYDKSATTSLGPQQALQNADSYGLFSQDYSNGCSSTGRSGNPSGSGSQSQPGSNLRGPGSQPLPNGNLGGPGSQPPPDGNLLGPGSQSQPGSNLGGPGLQPLPNGNLGGPGLQPPPDGNLLGPGFQPQPVQPSPDGDLGGLDLQILGLDPAEISEAQVYTLA
ncbi:Deuterolysin metalloprotease family protein [Metarhizium album ARSEF 1941]|uniref:Deuterolysin metalloprotease family protein n=1 Tax=Metarhizium album (strain ARSEF 1941) TaxID=1081103 RepID=A0A0B2X1E0_METAS|nr:Deuterolysin metalloprotease family protein [Metarhizium album ARSEF 1941]KHN98895.1 Deuterolysin metalloprotease family protein [Metarhizium album ARSEF 1941]